MAVVEATLTIDDEAAPDLFTSLIEMEIEEDHRMAAAFRIKLAIFRDDDGLWAFLDDERIKPWAKVVISADVNDEEFELILGYITHISSHIDEDETNSYLEIYGMDASSLMSVEEIIKDWPNKSDGDIAREIFQKYSLSAEVEDTLIIYDEAVSTIIQHDTDIQFLKQLARRNGYECFVKGETGFFRKPVLTEPPQPVLAAHFGTETNLVSFDVKVNALRPAAVGMHEIDKIGKQIQSVSVESGELRQLGRDSAISVNAPEGAAPRMFVRQPTAMGQQEMEKLCQALFDEAAWFVEATGEIESAVYPTVLQARKLVPIKGVGEVFSGIYYVTNVKHLFTVDDYKQKFAARRNALAPSGPGDFEGDGSLLGGIL